MSGSDWIQMRGDTIFLFEKVGDRDSSNSIIVFDGDLVDGCYDRVDRYSRKSI